MALPNLLFKAQLRQIAEEQRSFRITQRTILLVFFYQCMNLFNHLDVPPTQINILDGNTDDLKLECERYEEENKAVGGIKLFLSVLEATVRMTQIVGSRKAVGPQRNALFLYKVEHPGFRAAKSLVPIECGNLKASRKYDRTSRPQSSISFFFQSPLWAYHTSAAPSRIRHPYFVVGPVPKSWCKLYVSLLGVGGGTHTV